MSTQGPPVALIGPTASGKSAVALAIAHAINDIELVSIDSMQVYRGMNIGTAKPSAEEQRAVPHHLIDIVDPDHEFALAEFQQAARAAIDDIETRGKRALLVGGTGLYLQAVTDGFELPGQFPDVRVELERTESTEALHARLAALDSLAASRMEPSNRRRIVRALEVTLGSGRRFSSFGPEKGIGAYPQSAVRFIGLRMDPEINAARIEQRVDDMMASGLVEEVLDLRATYVLARTARQALGYKEILEQLDEHEHEDEGDGILQSPAALDIDTAADDIKRRTRSFARRQRAWFRRDPRIHWVDVDGTPGQPLETILDLVSAPDWPRP
jgi:tRNA dimethylallyltransferase